MESFWEIRTANSHYIWELFIQVGQGGQCCPWTGNIKKRLKGRQAAKGLIWRAVKMWLKRAENSFWHNNQRMTRPLSSTGRPVHTFCDSALGSTSLLLEYPDRLIHAWFCSHISSLLAFTDLLYSTVCLKEALQPELQFPHLHSEESRPLQPCTNTNKNNLC